MDIAKTEIQIFSKIYSQNGLKALLPSDLDLSKLAICLIRQLVAEAGMTTDDSVQLYLREQSFDEAKLCHQISGGRSAVGRYGFDLQQFWINVFQANVKTAFFVLGGSERNHKKIAKLPYLGVERPIPVDWTSVFGEGFGEFLVQRKGLLLERLALESQTYRYVKKERGDQLLEGWGVSAGVIDPCFGLLGSQSAAKISMKFDGGFDLYKLSHLYRVQEWIIEFFQEIEENNQCLEEVWIVTPFSSFHPFLLNQFSSIHFPNLCGIIQPYDFFGYQPLLASHRFLFVGSSSNRLILFFDSYFLGAVHLTVLP